MLSRVSGAAQEEIETALKLSFDQGYNLGLNLGWSIEQDKSYVPHWEETR